MRRIYKISILIGIILIFFLVNIRLDEIDRMERNERTSQYLEQQPTVNVSGTVKYILMIEGHSYEFVPEPEELVKIGAVDEPIRLVGFAKLNPEVDNKLVRIQGTFIENYTYYRLEIEKGILFSGQPTGPVIFVKDIQILN